MSESYESHRCHILTTKKPRNKKNHQSLPNLIKVPDMPQRRGVLIQKGLLCGSNIFHFAAFQKEFLTMNENRLFLGVDGQIGFVGTCAIDLRTPCILEKFP
ncbi:hypothetical protein TNCV_1907751 [Trichonephila clavipes]|nr:hypothetical protein TNCV_1907751 [Trichonephila clavipes]